MYQEGGGAKATAHDFYGDQERFLSDRSFSQDSHFSLSLLVVERELLKSPIISGQFEKPEVVTHADSCVPLRPLLSSMSFPVPGHHQAKS